VINFKAIDRAFDTERYVMSRFPDAQRSGANLIVTCPRCEKDKLWVLIVDRDDVRSPAWQCFSKDCADAGRTAFSLVRRLEDCDTFTALELIAKFQKGNEPLIDLKRLVEDRLVGKVELWTQPGDPIPLPDEFIAARGDGKRSDLPSYFAERGIGPKKAHRYGLGWCEQGYFKNRMVVPVTSDGKVVFFVARYMRAKLPLCQGRDLPCKRCGGTDEHKRVKKTVYPKGSKPGRYLFNYDRARKEPVIRIVEGALDAIHVGKSAVATFGTQLSQYQLELLMRSSASEIIIMWDPDAYDKARELADRLSDLWAVRVVKLPEGKDPDEIPLDELRVLEDSAPRMDRSAAFKSYVLGRLSA
jgi:hypothetical protein